MEQKAGIIVNHGQARLLASLVYFVLISKAPDTNVAVIAEAVSDIQKDAEFCGPDDTEALLKLCAAAHETLCPAMEAFNQMKNATLN